MSSARPLFVVGCHRSGTTVLRRILNTHPGIWLAKETQYLAGLDWAAGDWHRVRDRDALVQHVSSIRASLVATGWQQIPMPDALPGEVETLAAVYRWICQYEAPPERTLTYWGDNTPRYVSLIPELDRAFPDARYIHLVRDPRDVVRSARALWFGGNTALTAAEEWIERVAAGLAAERLVRDRLLLVRFEDLLLNPAAQLAAIASFLGLEDRFDVNHPGYDAEQIARDQAHLSKVAEPLDPRVIGRYKEALSERQIAEIEQLCQPLLRALGYESERWHKAWDPTHRFARYAGHYTRSLGINLARGLRRRLGG